MISVAEADALLQEHALKVLTEEVALSKATGRVLREELVADRCFPPFDRVTMDGIAIRYSDLKADVKTELQSHGSSATFEIVGVQAAGQPRLSFPLQPLTCLEIMTGAMAPLDPDVTIVPFEHIAIENLPLLQDPSPPRRVARINTLPTAPRAFIHPLGSDLPAGRTLVAPGRLLSAAEIAVAASIGKETLKVSRKPRIAVLATGDELVPVAQVPLPHQIRMSNAHMIASALSSQGIDSLVCHANDELHSLTQTIAELLDRTDVLVLSGGVSMGRFDHVPAVLEALGGHTHFHKVTQKPGKPLLFATLGAKAIFGLPGNPVSSMLCTFRYLLPWLGRCMTQSPPLNLAFALAAPLKNSSPFTHFVPVKLVSHATHGLVALPFPGNGSGDFANMLECDGFVEISPQSTPAALTNAHPFTPTRALHPLFAPLSRPTGDSLGRTTC